MTALRDFVVSQPLTVSFTGSDSAYHKVAKTLNKWGQKRQNHPLSPLELSFTPNPQLREGLAGPVQVAYCVKSYPALHYSDPNAPYLTPTSALLSDLLLHPWRIENTFPI